MAKQKEKKGKRAMKKLLSVTPIIALGTIGSILDVVFNIGWPVLYFCMGALAASVSGILIIKERYD